MLAGTLLETLPPLLQLQFPSKLEQKTIPSPGKRLGSGHGAGSLGHAGESVTSAAEGEMRRERGGKLGNCEDMRKQLPSFIETGRV